MRKLWLVLAFAGSAYAAELPPGYKTEVISDFSGGLNTNTPSHKLQTKYSPFMRNVFIDNDRIETGPGFAVLGSSRVFQKITGIFPFTRENGQVTFLVTDSSLTAETSDFNSWTFVSSASAAGTILTWIQVRNKMWGVNGIDFPITWNGSVKAIMDGTKGNPSVPKFKYPAYYQDRLWGLNASGAASDLYFASVVTTDNAIIAPDDSRAWPAINILHVGQGDGQSGTALFTFGGRLRAGKERSIYTIYGDLPTNYNPIKEEASVGIVSHESVVNLDGNVYFLGPGGIYENATRISDDIAPDIELMNKGISNNIQNSWETFADFAKGQIVGTTATAAGFVTTQERTFLANSALSQPSGSFLQFVATGTSDSGFNRLIGDAVVPGDMLAIPGNIKIWGRVNNTGLCGTAVPVISVKNLRDTNIPPTNNGTADITNLSQFGTDFSQVTFGQFGTMDFDSEEVNQASFSIKMVASGMNSGCVFDFYPATQTSKSTVELFASSNTQYISDVATLNMVNAWGAFESLNSPNGGFINFYIRSSTSSVNIATQTWMAISPGAILSFPLINNYVQWASTLNTAAGGPDANIDNVTIAHIEGSDSLSRAVAIDWQNRWWLSVSTISDNTKREIYVKSVITNDNTHAWMPIDGMDICSFAKFGNSFYGGSCSTGIIYRLDYGTSFNGSTIPVTYDLPDMLLGDAYFNKEIYKYVIDGKKKTNATLTVGSSVDEADVTNSTFSISGSGRYSHIVEGVRNRGKTLRLRLSNKELDRGMVINSVGIYYEPTKGMTNK